MRPYLGAFFASATKGPAAGILRRLAETEKSEQNKVSRRDALGHRDGCLGPNWTIIEAVFV